MTIISLVDSVVVADDLVLHGTGLLPASQGALYTQTRPGKNGLSIEGVTCEGKALCRYIASPLYTTILTRINRRWPCLVFTNAITVIASPRVPLDYGGAVPPHLEMGAWSRNVWPIGSHFSVIHKIFAHTDDTPARTTCSKCTCGPQSRHLRDTLQTNSLRASDGSR